MSGWVICTISGALYRDRLSPPTIRSNEGPDCIRIRFASAHPGEIRAGRHLLCFDALQAAEILPRTSFVLPPAVSAIAPTTGIFVALRQVKRRAILVSRVAK
jgi:hypothetical protein